MPTVDRTQGIKIWNGKTSARLRPTIHGPTSQLYQAFHSGPFQSSELRFNKVKDELGGNDPHRFIERFLENRRIKTGVIAEFGASRECSIPPLSGFKIFALSNSEVDLKLIEGSSPYATRLLYEMSDLPKQPLTQESCDLAIWNANMTYFLIAWAKASFDEYPEQSAMIRRAIKGMWKTIRPGGYFIEFYPFNDHEVVPQILCFMKLGVSAIDYVARKPGSLDPSELVVVSSMYADASEESFSKEFRPVFITQFIQNLDKNRSRIAAIVDPLPYNVMMVRKGER